MFVAQTRQPINITKINYTITYSVKVCVSVVNVWFIFQEHQIKKKKNQDTQKKKISLFETYLG